LLHEGQLPTSPYPNTGPDVMNQLLLEVRAGNANVNEKFAQLQTQICQLRADMVTKQQFESLENRVQQLEQVGPGPGNNNINAEFKALRAQLHRLDPAQKSVAFRGFVDTDLGQRVLCIKEILREIPGCPPVCHYDHILKGRPGERQPTGVTVCEFGNSAQREQVFNQLKDKILKDNQGGTIMCKRAQTTLQRDRNTKLHKACDEVKKRNADAKIDFMSRRVMLPGDVPVYAQDKDGLGGRFLPPFEKCVI